MSAVRVFTVVVVLLLAGCGGEAPAADSGAAAGDGASEVATTPTETPTAPPTAAAANGPVDLGVNVPNHGTEDLSGASGLIRLTLKMDDSDGLFFEPTYIKVRPGATVRVKVNNVGFVDHNISIDSLKIDKDVASEAKAAVNVTMPDADALRFYCSLHPGMAGAFYSEEGQDVQS